MNKVLFVAAFFLHTALAQAQTDPDPSLPPPRLIVRGDDMGFSHSGNLALMKCSEQGIQTTIEVIVPSPWFPEAVKMLEQRPDIDVGIHLVLTSEWDNIKWRPLTAAKSLRDSSGYFYPMIWPNENYPGRALLDNKWDYKEVEEEFRAQIMLAKKLIPRISHVSGHMGCTHINEETREITRKLSREFDIDIEPGLYGVKNVTYDGPSKTSKEKKASFIKMLNSLQPGETYLFVEHPGLNDAELKAIHHIGYENVAEDRQGVTDVWTDKKVKKVIRSKKINLIGYRDINRR